MAQSGYTPISLYYSTTASAVPLNTNLVAGELALNTLDEKLYFKNSAGTVKLLASNAASTGTVSSVAQSFTGGLISVAGSPITTSGTLALTVAGTSGGVPYFSSASAWASSAALTQYGIVYGGGAGAAPVATAAGTTGQVLTATTGSAPTWATPAASVSLSANNTWTGTQTFSGTSSATAIVLNDAAEVTTVSATAATGTIAYDITTQAVLYYTSSASGNWTVNFRGSSGTSLNTLMTTGQSMTVAFLVTQGSTAYYNSVVQVDGTTSGVTTRWLGGAPTAGNASGIDSYRYLIIKTGSATFTVLASNTQFKA
jgi:hypothetical protein